MDKWVLFTERLLVKLWLHVKVQIANYTFAWCVDGKPVNEYDRRYLDIALRHPFATEPRD